MSTMTRVETQTVTGTDVREVSAAVLWLHTQPGARLYVVASCWPC